MVSIVLLIVAAVCFLLAACGYAGSRVNLLALGLFFWVLVVLLGALGGHR